MMRVLLWLSPAWAEDAHHAAEHAAHGADTIPWSSLFVQAFNFTFLFILLVVLLRKTVKAHFANRAAEFNQLVARAEDARCQAEASKLEIEQRLAKLKASSANTATDARAEAEKLRARMLDEARAFARKLEADVERTANVELEKAKAALRQELLERALSNASESMRKGLGSSEQKKLQNEFVEKIQVVGG